MERCSLGGRGGRQARESWVRVAAGTTADGRLGCTDAAARISWVHRVQQMCRRVELVRGRVRSARAPLGAESESNLLHGDAFEQPLHQQSNEGGSAGGCGEM